MPARPCLGPLSSAGRLIVQDRSAPVAVVRLGPEEQPPGDDNVLLLECTGPGQPFEVVRHSRGMTIRVEPRHFDAEVAAFAEKASEVGIPKIYVRGQP